MFRWRQKFLASGLFLTAISTGWSLGELRNLSARLRLPAGGAPVIAGAVLAGVGTQTLLIRAIGPGLAGFGVAGALADPMLTVFDSAGRVVATNDNWTGIATADAAFAAGAFALIAGTKDAAVVVRVGAGPLTVHVSAGDSGGGVVLIELYALDSGSAPHLANLSVLAGAGTGSDTLAVGFVIRGSVLPLLIRGIGPGLNQLGVAGATSDPRIAVFDSGGVVLTTNDDWDSAGNSFVRQAATDTGAFPLSGGSKDAATLIALASGAYTAQVATVGAGGNALIEVYATPAETAEINGSLRGEPGNIQDNVFQSLCIDPRDSHTVYIGTETNGIFKTSDGGESWTRLRRGLRLDPNRNGYPQIYEIIVDPQDSKILYAATIAAPGPATGSGVEVLRSGIAGVYKSVDGGLSWEQRISGFVNTYTPHVVFSKRDSRVLYAGVGGAKSFETFYDGGLLISRDGAESWQPLAVPAGTPQNTPVTLIATLRDGVETLFASYMVHGTDQPTAFGLYATSDTGATWAARNPDGLVVQNFDVFARDSSIIYANDDTQKRLHKSADGGRTWVRTPLGNFGPIKISPATADIAVYTGFTTLMKSADGLNTARTVLDDTTYLGTRQFMDVRFAPGDPRVVWAAAKGYLLYRSTDGGDTFTRITRVREMIYGVGN